MKKILSFVLVLCLVMGSVFMAVGCGGSEEEADAAPEYTFKVATVLAESNPVQAGIEAFKAGVEEASGGKIKVELYPNSQLGDTKDFLAQTMAGSDVISNIDAGQIDDLSKEIQILGAPYIVETYDDVDTISKSDIFATWSDAVEEQGLKILCFNYWQGPRHFVTNKEIKSMDDLKGMKIRTVGTPAYAETVKAFGAAATALPWGDVYQSIETKVVDGCEAQSVATYGSKLYETCDYITKTGHLHLVSGLAVNADLFNSMPEEYQQILIDEAQKSGVVCGETTNEVVDQLEAEMVGYGMTITEIDTAPFKEAAAKVYEILDLVEEKAEIDALLGR